MQNVHPRELLLDSAPEASFDRLTRLAARHLQVPVSLVSILDVDRQFFKSQCGLPEPYASTRETPLSYSFCKHVVDGGQPLVVEDARIHPLVFSNPAVSELGVIAYLGVPLLDDEGQAYGALCAIDTRVRRWTPMEIEFLETIAAQVMSEIVLIRALGTLIEAQSKTETREQDRALAVRADRHDLKTPLNALLMGLQAIRFIGNLDQDQAELVDLAERNANALAQMIDQMLDIVVIEGQGKAALAKRFIYPADLVQRALEQVRMLAGDKHQEFKSAVETSSPIYVDADKLVRVLVNILANAIKFTPPDGEISLEVKCAASETDPAVQFSVRDSGIGISEAALPHIFAEGFRVDKMAPTRRSTGLGLTFCKRIIEAHEGRIWVESTLGAGTTFHFVIPAK